MTDNEKIAMLTTGAIKSTMENAAKAMMAAVEAAEEKTRELRGVTEQFIVDFEKVTSELSNNVNAHVLSCQAAIDSFQEHHLKILNVDSKDNSHLARIADEIGKVQSAPSPVDGKR
jgi:hypothetical protein